MNPPFDDRTLWDLRVAATLVAAIPVNVTVTDGPRTVLEVRRPPFSEQAHPVVPPCWFRSMVAGARLGSSQAAEWFVDQLAGAESLSVGVDLRHCGAGFHGAIWRLDHPGSSIYVFATALSAAQARAALAGPAPELGFFEDAGTGVTLVSKVVPGPGPHHRDPVVTMLGRCTAAELEADLAASR